MNLGGVIRLNKCGFICLIFTCLLLILYIFSKSSKVEQVNTVNLRKLLIAAIEVAEKGGKEVSYVRSLPDINIKSKGKTKEGANDPLTNADKKSHCVMYYGLTQAFPKVKVISEEEKASEDCDPVQLVELDPRGLDGQADPGDEFVPVDDVTVWIDPLDATQEFTENLLSYVTTLVCVAVRGKPIIGVIHKPFADEPKTTWSWLGKAKSADLQHLKQVEQIQPLSIIVSRSHAGRVEEVAKKAFGPETKVIPAGGAGYKVLEVIAGNATAYIHTTNIKKWDICAGNAIIHAAGGDMTTLKNEQIDYSSGSEKVNTGGLFVSLGTHHDELIQKLSNIKR
ncbi:Putative inositol monophosphatase 3 [Frankliniella fusca]|uniref:Putative inositol monophosphatase 3 n=1 Tax=Frankliniella fusca TaxID=407009 RepID=A0AAE1H5K5_9NEOP|nr:Putative inositol monophosphatase 3 [Frankliniella fusca]